MKCPGCGSEVPAFSNLCPNCRASLSGVAVASGVLTPPPLDATTRLGVGGTGIDTTGLPSSYGAGPLEETPTGLPFPPSDPFGDAATQMAAARPDARGDLPTMMSTPPAGENADEALTMPVSTSPASAGRTKPSRSSTARASGDTGPLEPGQPFGPRYHIIRLLGLGGMGAVYQAWDGELGVAVAIKVIRPDVMADPMAAREIERRFKRELLLARQVTHKNVVRIHDLGEIDGIKYITMSYVDGTDLASILKSEGSFAVAKALAVLRPVVSGLVAAHTAGVVHRDLKPANIMIGKDGEALIMDFGIARSTGTPAASGTDESTVPADLRRAAANNAGATMAGAVLGTIHYMAPEQAKGLEVDQRADIYALGLIVYDMLLGRRRAEHHGSALDELEARIEKAPPPLRSVAPEIPSAVDALVSRCLEPDPATRYQTTAELAADLNRLDENGDPLPIRRVVGIPFMAATVLLLLGLAGGTWWYQRQFIPPAVHDPVSVMIADFQNGTGDPTFDRTLEPALRIALEGAGFIAAYDRTQMRNLGLPAVAGALDEATARQIAVSQGFGVVLAGSLNRQARGYTLSVRAIEAVTGNVIRSGEEVAASKEQVLSTATRLAATVRTALGDETSESAQIFAMETLNARSLDVIHEYAAGMEALNNGKYEEARQSAAKAAALDPDFGSAYGVMAAASRGLGQRQEADNYIKEAVARLDRVTERERYRIRGLSFLLSGDQQKCVEEYSALISRYASDATAHNNLALCATLLRDMPKAIEEMKQAVAILPKSVRQRSNFAVYASYGGDFATGEREAREVQTLDPKFPKGFIALAFAHLGQDRVPEAASAYGALKGLSPSDAAAGLADLALYQGRLTEAARILEAGATADLAAKSADRAADKFALLAYTQLTRGQTDRASAAADRALGLSQGVKTRFLAGRIFAMAGNTARARTVAETLASELYAEPQAYAKIIEANIALQGGNARQAIQALTEANRLLDTWMGRFDLGRAYLEAGAYLEADAEFDRCVKRRGEAMALLLDEIPTYGYFPPVHYYVGRVREGLKISSFADSYRAYLNIRGQAGEDPLLVDVRRRAGQ